MIHRITAAIHGAFLMLFRLKRFHPGILAGSRVAVIGAADSALEAANGDYIEQFDVVIRVNKALTTWNSNNEMFVGKRTDILFHSFYENVDRGGAGPLDWSVFDKFGVQYLLQPRNNQEGLRVIFNYFKKYRQLRKVYVLPKAFYHAAASHFGHLKPTMGFCALDLALRSPCSEVFITGFTFFRTPYSKGYRDHLIDMRENEKHIKSQGQHDVALEYRLFVESLKMVPSSRTVLLDRKLYEILKSDSFPFTENIRCFNE